MLVAESQANWLPARETHTKQADAADDEGGAEVVDVDLTATTGRRSVFWSSANAAARRAGPPRSTSASRVRGVDDEAADQPSGDGGHREDGADVAGVAAALARGDHAGDDDLDQRGQAADAEALDDAGADQHLHPRREAGDERADREDDERTRDQQLLAKQVG